MSILPSLKEEIKRDYDFFMGNKNPLACYDDSKELLGIQSIEGHVSEGHALIKKSHSNFTIEKVVLALDKDPDEIKERRQARITQVFDCLNRVIDGEETFYQTIDDEPLFGYHLFEKFPQIQDPLAFLKGLYLGSVMDTAGARDLTSEIYNIPIRTGRCCWVDLVKLVEYGMDLKDLSRKPHTKEELKELHWRNIINLDGGNLDEFSTMGYVQLNPGLGTSDDLAILTAGVLFGFDAALGLFLADAVDTWDKYVPIVFASGQDDKLKCVIDDRLDDIRKNLGSFTPPDELEIARFISHIAKVQYKRVTSTSQRHFNTVRKKGVSVIENYLGLVLEDKVANFRAGSKEAGMFTADAAFPLFSRLNSLESDIIKERYGHPLIARIKQNGRPKNGKRGKRR